LHCSPQTEAALCGRMTRFWIFTTVLLLAMLLLFFVGQALQLPFLTEDTSFLLSQKKWVAALAGIGLLIVDVVAPVPSSIIMVANGMLFGPVWGTLLSVMGGAGAALVGYWIGLRGERAGKRWLGNESLTRANAFFQSYGMMAVIVSRPVPILAEAVTIIAGMSRMPARKFFPAMLLGLLPTAIIYAVAGAYALNLQSGLYVFLAVMVLAGVVWLVGKLATRSKASPSA
jgi:uncharacterized membrane protein YdjX (TVP38/TMEM64 family)